MSKKSDEKKIFNDKFVRFQLSLFLKFCIIEAIKCVDMIS